MKNITLAIEEDILSDVREIAARRRTTVNGLVRDFLGQLAAEESRVEKARAGLIALMEKSTADLGRDYQWSREALYEERMLPRHQHSDLRGGRKKKQSGQVRNRRKTRQG